MNTEKLVIFEQANGKYKNAIFNAYNKNLDFFRDLANKKGFYGGIEIIFHSNK